MVVNPPAGELNPGDMAIKWDQMESIETKLAVQAILEDKTYVRGILKAAKTADLQLKTDEVMDRNGLLLVKGKGSSRA